MVDVVNVISWVLVLALIVSFVMAAVTSIRFRRAAKVEETGIPAQRKTPMSTHHRIVYIVAFVSATAVGLVYIGSFGSVQWAWPAFVVISLIIVGGGVAGTALRRPKRLCLCERTAARRVQAPAR
jgi:DMSO reductase anchor subunit